MRHRFPAVFVTTSLLALLSITLGPRLSWSFSDGFDSDGAIEEAGSMSESSSPDWWVNSGGRLISESGLGMTVQGSLPSSDRWRVAYAGSNPADTDDGFHPQNIFRLVSRGNWKDFEQQAYFRISANNLSSSSNRNASNGLLFFHRYQDGNNLYYAGIRVDGFAVVKKKLAGTYTTLGYSRVYPGTYDRIASPNLIPVDRWIGIRTTIRDDGAGDVSVKLELDDPGLGAGWRPVLEAVDTTSPILASGHAGIRTDFMDVQFEGYQADSQVVSTPTPTPTPSRPPDPTPTPTAAPAVCGAPSLGPATAWFPQAGGPGSVAVTAPSGCGWSVRSSAEWIEVTSGPSGAGSGVVSYRVAPNGLKKSRKATLSVAGRTFAVRQAAR